MNKSPQDYELKRIMIVGAPGSGKSWLANRLSEKTKLPVIHIDQFYYEPGWVMRPSEETASLILCAAQKDTWILDGNNAQTFAERAARADHLVFLDRGLFLRLYRVIRRTLKYYGKTRPDLAPGCPERFTFAFMLFVMTFGIKRRKRMMARIDTVKESIACYHLKSTKQVENYLKTLS